MFQKTDKIKRYFVESLAFSFGIYFGMFFSYVIQQVVETYKASIVLTEHSYKFGIGGDLTFTDVINKCSALSNTVIVLSVYGTIVLFAFLFIILYYVDEISRNDEIEILILSISLLSWLIAPIAIIYTSTRNPLLYIGLDAKNVTVPVSELAILSENYRYLDQFWYFGNSFIYEIKILSFIVALLASSAFLKSKKISGKKISPRKIIFVVLMPVIFYAFLEFFLPTMHGISYSVGQVSIGIGGIGIIGGPAPVEPFITLSQAIILISWILLLIQAYNHKKQKKPRFRMGST